MLRRVFPMLDSYLKSRVILFSYKANAVMIQTARNDFLSNKMYFESVDPMHYYELNFLSYLVQHYQADQQMMSPNEQQKYKEGVDTLQKYREFMEVNQTLTDLNNEIKTIYHRTTMENAMSNVISRREFLDEELKEDLQETIHKYVQLVEDLKDFPEWQEKVKSNIGNYVHLMYNNLCSDPHLSGVFEGFDKQHFFK